MVYPYNGILVSHRKEMLIHTTTLMSPTNVTLSERSQFQKPRVL